MRFRKGFVTNSSSTSYICEVCGHTGGGFDYDLYDVGFVQCENYHEFCAEHLINMPEEYKNRWDRAESFLEDHNLDRYEVPEKYCPICQMGALSQNDWFKWLEFNGITRENSLNEIKEKYSSYNEFKEAMAK